MVLTHEQGDELSHVNMVTGIKTTTTSRGQAKIYSTDKCCNVFLRFQTQRCMHTLWSSSIINPAFLDVFHMCGTVGLHVHYRDNQKTHRDVKMNCTGTIIQLEIRNHQKFLQYAFFCQKVIWGI